MWRQLISLLLALIGLSALAGCSESFQNKFTEISIGTYAESFDDVSKFSNVYGMWKDNIDTVYVQAGVDDYTDTYLLEKMPNVYSSILNSFNKYEMKAYALLDSDIWIYENDTTNKEIKNILNYNSNFEDKKFEGVNINPDLSNATKKQLETYYKNIEKAKKDINAHNKLTGDNLTLSIKVNEEIEDKDLEKMFKIADEVIYESKLSSIEEVEELLTLAEGKGKKIVVVVDSEDKFFDKNYVTLLRDLNDKVNRFSNYKSFNGFVINDYDKYSELLKAKRP